MSNYKQFRDESMLKEAFDSPAYPFSLDAKSNSMDRFYLFTDDKGATYRVWFEKRQNLGKKVSRVVIGQNTSGRIFKKVIGRFDDPMRVMGTILAIFRDAVDNDTYVKQQDGFTLGLPKNIPPNVTRLAGRLIQRAIMGSRFEMAKGVDFSDEEFDYIGVIKRGAREEQVFDGRLAAVAGTNQQKAETTMSNSPTQRANDGFGALIGMDALTKEDFERVMADKPVTYADIDFNPAGNSSTNFQASVSFKRGQENVKVGFGGAYGKTIALTTLTVNGVTKGFMPVGGLYRVNSVEQQKKTLADIFKGADAKALGQIIDAVAPGTPMDVAPTSGVHIRDMLSKNQKAEVAWYLTSEGKAELENIFGSIGEKPNKAKFMAFLKKYGKSLEWTVKGGEVTGKSGDLSVYFKAMATTTYKVQQRIRDPRGTKYQIYLDGFGFTLDRRHGNGYHSISIKTMLGEDKESAFYEEREKFMDELKALGIIDKSVNGYMFYRS